MNLSRIDVGLEEGDSFVAWAPMFHMVSLEHALHVLGLGGKAIAEALLHACRADLSSYKLPKEIRFVSQADFPRSTSGKVQRQLVERWLDDTGRQ